MLVVQPRTEVEWGGRLEEKVILPRVHPPNDRFIRLIRPLTHVDLEEFSPAPLVF